VIIPAEGYYEVAEVRLGFHAGNVRDGTALTPDDAFSLYAEIDRGSIHSFSMAPDPLFTRPATDISKPAFTRSPGRRLASSTTISISISGRIQYEATNSPPGGVPILNGVPNVRVGFDWNRDNNSGTIEMPSYDGGADPYTYTDANGDYTFTRQVTVDDGAPIWSTRDIRVFARMSNDAGYNEDYGFDAIFPEYGHTAISISPGSPNISATGITATVNRETGAALRYMWRAREFAINDLGLFVDIPPPIRFDIDHDDVAHFNEGFSILVTPSITFTGITNSETGYHEYGHYVHHHWAGIPGSNCPSPHFIDLVSEDGCAFNEGWAEFHAAAAHFYWYMRESPAFREDDHHGAPVYQFMDCNYSTIPVNTGNEEGAVARFIYNLWDGVALRMPSTPGYTGDNDDLDVGREQFGHPRPWILYSLLNVEQYETHRTGPLSWSVVRKSPLIAVYRDNYLKWVNSWYPLTFPYHRESINAMYDALTSKSDSLRSATPTILSATGNKTSRLLTWNDNTEPASITYLPEVNGPPSIFLSDNDEAGFLIWRKAWTVIPRCPPGWGQDPGIMDGRLDRAYQRLVSVGSNVHQYTDVQTLTPGIYSYVVVAYATTTNGQADDLSIPKAEATIVIGETIDSDHKDPCDPIDFMKPGGQVTLTATGSGSTNVNTTYQWIAKNKPSYVALTGTGAKSLTITNNYAQIRGYNPIAALVLFSVRCIVTTSGVADTTPAYYPAYAPLDTAARSLSVASGNSMLPDGNLLRSLDFIVQPGEDIISVRPLTVTPTYDSTNGYVVMVKGFPKGSIEYNEARLLVVEHPPGTELGGSAACGFKVFTRGNDGTMVEDTSRLYGLEEQPLQLAYHSALGDVTSQIAGHDTLRVKLTDHDSMALEFTKPVWNGDFVKVDDSTVAVNTSRAGWIKDFILELRGTYSEPPPPVMGTLPASIEEGSDAEGYSLAPGRPNPASSTATIEYTLGSNGPTTLRLYDTRGEVIRTLVDADQRKGSYSVTVDLSALDAGIYYYRLSSGSWSRTRALTVVR
jgi:hypothetical protein